MVKEKTLVRNIVLVFIFVQKNKNKQRAVGLSWSKRSMELKKMATECMVARAFWPAERYHQQYLEKGGQFNNPLSAEKQCTDTIGCYG